ncbi:hypothetical protein LPMP_332900 [Leishmania panamensis]|uniref:BEACH domain-containing protein n=1 Tax=Leishmania panamensis TaxID=5679 RepID=A0A088S053_LEIPA|nr:hypothetical protein LPMP_332900 [Leishmania panamensis]AIO01581.1 hypothetical protein LPMP_332900 [Leishmania panamensis]
MQSLSERDLGRVEKLFNSIRRLLDYDEVRRRHDDSTAAGAHVSSASALAATVAPSTVFGEHQDQPVAGGASNSISERRLWAELAFLMSRVIFAQKLSLMSYVTSDPGLMVAELARILLTFLKESCASVAGSGKVARMHHVALLAQDRLFFLMRVFCSLKNCTIMLSDTSGRNNAGAALEVFDTICNHVLTGQHLTWMSHIYVWFCDEAARLARSGGAIPSAYVYATHDTLRCILGCCTDNEACAKAFLYSEPVACVTHMFYGLKLRISLSDLLRPYEDERPIAESAKVTAGDAPEQHTSVVITDNNCSSYGTPFGATDRDELQRTSMRASPIPQRPPGAGYLKTRYFTTLTASRAQQHSQQMPREGNRTSPNSAAVASLAHNLSSSATNSTAGTSWAFDLPDLSTLQLKALLLGGRENAFDSLLFAALDVVIEVMRMTRDYAHWMVLSTVNNLLLLSKKSIEVGDVAAVSPPLSQIVAMYENIMVLFQFLLLLMQGMDFEKPVRPVLRSTSSAPATSTPIGAEKEAQKGDRKGTQRLSRSSPLSSRPSPFMQLGAEGTSTTRRGEMDPLPATAMVENKTMVTSMDSAQLREHISQEIVHMVLQTDVHAVLVATMRILECDQTLFRVLHSFCMLDGRPTVPAKSTKGRGNTSVVKAGGTTLPKRGIGKDTVESVPTFNTAVNLFVTSNFGDLRNIAKYVECSDNLDDGLDANGGSQRGSCISMGTDNGRGNELGGSSIIASRGTMSFLDQQPSSPKHSSRQQQSEGGGGNKKRIKVGAGGGKSFAKSFLKSFFGSRTSDSAAATTKHGVASEGNNNDMERNLSSSSTDVSSYSCSESDAGSSIKSSSDSRTSDDNNLLSCARGTLEGSGVGSLLSKHNFGESGGYPLPWKHSSSIYHALKGGGNGRHHRRKRRARVVYSEWRDVPSYTALARELVRILNFVLEDVELSVDVRLGAGLLLPSVVLRDKHVFRLYEGHMLIRNYLTLLLRELQYNIKLRGMSTPAAADSEGALHTSFSGSQEEQQSVLGSAVASLLPLPKQQQVRSSSSMTGGRAHLTQQELMDFAPKVIQTLEQTFKVLGVIPLTSDVASLTELPLYFCTDGGAPLGIALECWFTRVVVLWLIGLVGAQCDEDIDRHAMEVLLLLMSRAVARGSLPKDSSRTLRGTPSGAATVVQCSTTAGVAAPSDTTPTVTSSSADWANARHTRALSVADGAAGVMSSPFLTSLSTHTFSFSAAATELGVSTAAAESMAHVGPRPPSSGSGLNGAEHDAEMDPQRNPSSNSLLGTTKLAGLMTAAAVDTDMVECGNTVEALSLVFRVLLSRSQDLLSPAGLSTVLSLFTSSDNNLSLLGRECMTCSLEIPSVYPLYTDVIVDSNAFLLTKTLSVISAYLTSTSLTPVTRRERRLWMQRCGCVDAAIRVLARVLDSPQSTPNFMRVIPLLFQFLSAFESGDCKPPQLSSTNFIVSVTERLAKLKGMEYFIIVTQAVLDASTGTFGSTKSGYTNACDPETYYTEMQVIGSFRIALHNCAAEKPIFLELLPSLLTLAKGHSDSLFTDLVEVLFRILKCTSIVSSERLLGFIFDHELTQMLPYLELSGRYVEKQLPFTGTAADLQRFWQPILVRSPRRSALRFTSHGGVQVSVGLWPDKGFSISTWFNFDRLYSTIPLFEFQGVLSDSGGVTSTLRGLTTTAFLFIFGGDSVQLTMNDGRRITVNESHALQNFSPNKWVHVCAVLRPTHVCDAYISGFKVGTTAFPYFAAGAAARVNVGFTDDVLKHATLLTTDTSPLFSMGDIALWAQPLSQSQVQAELANDGDRRGATTGAGCPVSLPAKIREEGIPQELTMMGVMSQTTGPSGMVGLSFATANSTTAGASDNFTEEKGLHCGGAWSASAARMARFVPFENEDDMLRNVLANPTGFPVIAKLVGRYTTPPKSWVDYPLLWVTRGGIVRMLDWMHLVTSSTQLEDLLKLILECMQRTTIAATLDPRTYLLFAYMLRNHVARYMTNTTCDQLLELASSHINIFDEEHRVVINRLAFEHVLSDFALYAALQLDTALYLLKRIRRLFHTSQCRYARHNARFVSPYRFIDRLLHSLIGAAARTPLQLHRAVVKVAQQVVVACDMEDGLVQIFISLAALLTPEESMVSSRRNPKIKVVLPEMRAVTRGTDISLRTANHLTTLLLSTLVECFSQSPCVLALSHTVDLPWYSVCVSRFADPAAVVYATRIFFEAVQHNPVLQEEVAQHQSAVVEVLTEHAVHEDLILLLLALTIGAARHIDVLSHKHSLRQQLDSLLSTFTPEPNMLVSPIFVQLLVTHLHRIVQCPRRCPVKAQTVQQEDQRLLHRVRCYFSVARVCSRLMILIRVRRYRALLIRHRLSTAGTSSVEMPILSLSHHQRVRSSGIGSSSSQITSFAFNSEAGVIAGAAPAELVNASFASSSHSRAPLSSLSPSLRGVDAATGRCSSERSGAATGVALRTTQSQLVRGSYGFGRRSTGGCGSGDRRCEGDLPLSRTPPKDTVGPRSLLMLSAPAVSIGNDDHTASSADTIGEAPKWKLPVLLPDMWATPLSPLHRTAVSHESIPAASSATSAAGGHNTDIAMVQRCQAPSEHGVSRMSVHLGACCAHDSAGDDSDASSVAASVDVIDTQLKASSDFRVHSRKHRRAFAVLHVSLLLWLPLQVKRCQWVLIPHSYPSEEDLSCHNAGTLFCIRTLHHFASMSNNFYLFVNSPMQTAALSSLVAYISRDMLLEQLDMWEQMISLMEVAPVRGSEVGTATVTATVATMSTTTEKHHQQPLQKDTPVPLAVSLPADRGIKSAEDTEGDGEGEEVPPVGSMSSASFNPIRRISSSDKAMATATKPIMLDHHRSNSSVDAYSVDRESVHEDAESEMAVRPPQLGLSETVQRRLTRPSSMTFRTAESSSTQLDKIAALESLQPSFTFGSEELDDAEAERAGAERRCCVSLDDGDVSSVTNSFFDVEGLLPAKLTHVPSRHRRKPQLPPQSLRLCTTELAQDPYTEVQDEERGSSATTAAATIMGRDTTAAATAGLHDSNEASPAKPDASGNNGDNDDTSSVSSSETSVRSHISMMSSSSLTSVSLTMPSTMADTKRAVSAPIGPFSNLSPESATLRGHNPSNVDSMTATKIIESVGEVVRRDAVSLLRALIRSSLDTLPMPNWVGGSAYGSCGGLLFQLLFITTAKAPADDSTTTLVRYFLLGVSNAVKEKRDLEVGQASHHCHFPSLSKSVVSVKATPTGLDGSLLGRPASTFWDTSMLSTAAGAGASIGSNVGGLPTNESLASVGSHTRGMSLSAVSISSTSRAVLNGPVSLGVSGAGLAPLGASQMGADDGVGLYSQHSSAPLTPKVPGQTYVSMNSAALPTHHHVPLSSSFNGAVSASAGHAQHHSSNSNLTSATGAHSDVFLSNLSHFTDLIVDMLAINVLDLSMVTHFFLTLLVLCQGWPKRYVDQLSWQVMQVCIAVLNRPSTQDASVGLIESVYTLSTLVLRRGWKHKGVLESLLRVLYRVFVSLPPSWMTDADARHRKRLITLIFRHIVQTYGGTRELEKALTMRMLTQRLSLYDDFLMVFSLKNEDECCATFDQYCIDQFSSIDTLMSGRLKAKADLAYKASIKTRSEYIKRIKAFNGRYIQVMEVTECYRPAALRLTYASRFSSFVATTPHVDASQLHWLLSSVCALRENHTASHATPWCMPMTGAGGSADSSAALRVSARRTNAGEGAERTLYHFMDPQMNYGELKGVRWGEWRDSHEPIEEAATSATTTPGALDLSCVSGSSHTDMTRGPMNANSASSPTKTSGTVALAAEVRRSTEEHPPENDLVHAAECEELVQHIAVLVPPLSTHCRPHIGDDAFRTALKDLSITLTPSAITLLRYLVAPHETVRFLGNGFRINGIHATPCLILLTNVTLKVISFSRVTEGGDVILCEHAVDDDDTHSRGAPGELNLNVNNNNNNCSSSPGHHNTAGGSFDDGKWSLTKSMGRNLFSTASMARQLQKLFYDNSTKRRQHQDGTRVAQAVRQVMSYNYQNIYWTYLVSSIRAVRPLHYMHLNTAVQLLLYYDNGPMLSVVDAKQSMNPSARKEFIKALKDVVGTQQCTFIDENQRGASMRTHLVRWATGSLSNYEYLRFLNEVAGRTNRDLNQYPIFPWVLADYTSTTLDLEAASTFRDFAYPMGAQTETRRTAAAKLYENTREVCDAGKGEAHPFHHGTHYSTSGGVLYFLVRAQPFTTYARLFQGGDFDLAMRLFDSVAASFASCMSGSADCKELIPEFYVNSGFLANADHLHFGTKSNGEAVDDVRLPPWAKNSQQVFTAVMRYALECPYVVEHLHQWIDLVFGVRRRGPLAVERYNVFQRMTYGEEVAQALKNAETPHDCDVIIAEVDNFGQTPPQLFQELHPSHHELAPVVKASPLDGDATRGGGGVMTQSDNHSTGGGGSAASWSVTNVISAMMLGGLYTSATVTASSAAAVAGAGNQLGVTFSNLVSSGSFTSGQTYTQTFRREAPKVVRMLIHAMDETQTWFVLRDPPGSVLQHPSPPALTDVFCFSSQAVLHFSMLRTTKKLACAYAQLVPVADTDYYLCWHEREARLMRYTTGQATFHSTIAFDPRDENGARISAVAAGPRESVLLVAISSGAVYCLFPNDTGDGALHVRGTLCYHRSPVTKIALESKRHRAVTITHSAGDDEPILWRVQRSGCCFVCRLGVQQLLPTLPHSLISPTSETTSEAAEGYTVVDVAIDTVSGNVALVTARSLLLFDTNGEPFGVGTLPSPTSLSPVSTVTLKDDNGDVGVAVSRPVLCVADITAVAFYQTSEWASGMGMLLTGHRDGSLSAWRTTRLPPHTVAPGKIAMVEFHARLLSGSAMPTASTTAGSFTRQQDAAPAGAGSRGSVSMSGAASLGTSGGAPGAAAGITGTGAMNCPVTALHQENADVPTFLVGYANGTVRQLVFEDPVLSSLCGSGGGGAGGGSSGSGNTGDDRSQRRRCPEGVPAPCS